MNTPAGLLLLAAGALDWVVGDPPRPSHPVVLIGRAARGLERLLWREASPFRQRAAGALLVAIIVAGVPMLTMLVLLLFVRLAPFLATLAALWLLATSLSARDLYDHAVRVERALAAADVPTARTRVAAIVGRKTHDLSPAEVARAAVESVAENSGDGVVAPLFYATLGFLWAPWGVRPALAAAALALGYKAVNTLDSMFGHKDPRYVHFGWASARLDDLVNYVPSRLGALLVVAAAPMAGADPVRAASTLAHDGRRHPSPNSGLFEAAYAGALGVRLGGENRYGDRVERRPHLGEALHPLDAGSIRRALHLLIALSVLATVIAAALTAGFAP